MLSKGIRRLLVVLVGIHLHDYNLWMLADVLFQKNKAPTICNNWRSIFKGILLLLYLGNKMF